MTDNPQWMDTDTILAVLAGRFPAMVFIAETDMADGGTKTVFKAVGAPSRVEGMLHGALRRVTE